MPIQLIPEPETLPGARIVVVGVGGGGGNILNSMVSKGIDGVEFIAINTDAQSLNTSLAQNRIQIGKSVTRGLGTGMNDEKGAQAAEESKEDISKVLKSADMVFITAGMGGGTGTGAAPVVAKIARSVNALVVAVVTKPFNFEGKPRMVLAEKGIERLKTEVDSVIVIPNQNILNIINEEDSAEVAFDYANRVLYDATKGISQIVTKHGEVNVDFADVKTIMKGMGEAMIGMGIAKGEDRAKRAAESALINPVLDRIDITNSKSVLVNIVSGSFKMKEIELINKTIQDVAGEEAKYILGIAKDPNMKDEIMVTVIATGFPVAASSSITLETFIEEAFAEPDVVKETSPTKIEEEIKEVITGKEFEQDFEYEESTVEDVPEVNNVIEEAVINTKKRELNIGNEGQILSIPTSERDLKALDVPAYKRRGILESIDEDLNEPEQKKESSSDDDISLDDFSINKNVNFLRKYMQ
jgi:cell division protein FtsZ